VPQGPVVSFGLAGGLHDGLECGEVLDATRVVDTDGVVLWEGGPLGLSGARTATIVAVDEIVDDPAERRTLYERTGADAIDMESGALARTGRLAGCLRAISDTPSRPLGPLAEMMDANGKLRPGGIVRALAAPRRTGRALADVRRALTALQQVVTRPNGAVA
jgi:nucleoside phosphorylase